MTNVCTPKGEPDTHRLKHFPISFLGMSLGLTGFTLAWQKAEILLALPVKVSPFLLPLSLGIFLLTIIFYSVKAIRYPQETAEEFRHPVKMNFYPIIAKVMLITSIIFLELNPTVSAYAWWAGVFFQSVFTVIVMSAWIRHEHFEISHINPSWFIPVVGSIMIPIAGVKHFSPELSWFFFSVGFFWWLILTVLVIYRIIFHNPIADKLMPTLAILFAPPVIGFISLTKLLGSYTPAAGILYYFGLFMFMLILFQYPLFSKIKFYLSWWAYSFPLDALTIGTLLMYHSTGLEFFRYLSLGLLAFLSFVIVFLLTRTLKGIKNRELCIED